MIVRLAVALFVCLAPARAEFYGVVSSASPEATAAGVEILEAGGNAIDAAVAVQFALAVTEPAMSGLGGGTQIILMKPGEEPVVINGTTRAPAALPDMPTKAQLTTGRTAATIPSTVKVFDFAWREYGSGDLAWPRLLQSSIRYAEDGFVVGRFRAAVYRRHEQDLRKNAVAAALFLSDGKYAPREGELVKMPVLAQTLRRLAEKGGEDFYTGGVAADIAADMQANGGWITADDLATFPAPKVQRPLHAVYRGHDVYTINPPAGGWVVLQALNILERTKPSALAQENDARALALVRALYRAHSSRARGPVRDFDNYGAEVAPLISDETAAALAKSKGGETTHFSIVDRDGMAVAVTTSIDSYFGSREVSPKLGFFYNNYMQAFDAENPDDAFALRPGGYPLSSMSATIVTRDGVAVLAVGSPGSARIISAVTQVISHFIDVGAGIGAAVEAPRVHAVASGAVMAEQERLSPEFLSGLAKDGLALVRPDADLSQNERNAYFGGVHAIGREALGWRGAADPRRDGTVGYAQAPRP